MRRRAKVDDNQKEIIKVFRDLGAYVLHTHQLKACCDCILVYKGSTVAIEIKDGTKVPSKRTLSTGEEVFRILWTNAGGTWEKIESTQDARELMGRLWNT